MSDENALDGFMDGFAKMAEAHGLRGEQVLDLLKLAADLAVRNASPDAFDSGFAASVIGV